MNTTKLTLLCIVLITAMFPSFLFDVWVGACMAATGLLALLDTMNELVDIVGATVLNQIWTHDELSAPRDTKTAWSRRFVPDDKMLRHQKVIGTLVVLSGIHACILLMASIARSGVQECVKRAVRLMCGILELVWAACGIIHDGFKATWTGLKDGRWIKMNLAVLIVILTHEFIINLLTGNFFKDLCIFCLLISTDLGGLWRIASIVSDRKTIAQAVNFTCISTLIILAIIFLQLVLEFIWSLGRSVPSLKMVFSMLYLFFDAGVWGDWADEQLKKCR